MNNILNTILLNVLLLCFVTADAQTTVGLKLITGNAFSGYTLFSPLSSTTSYLIDNCGEVVNKWECDDEPYYTAYLMPNGNLIRFGGYITSNAEYIEMRDWDNNVLWKWTPGSQYQYIHSDLAILPNNNFLLLREERFTPTEWINAGGNPANLGTSYHALEAIVEVQPNGATGANVVWEWKVSDHLIQDFDASKSNYGVVADHPELWDINNPNTISSSDDKMHFNGIDYNIAKDQIVLSCFSCSEIFILDHSTNTNQAAAHNGGLYGKGGDFLYRYGNPENYDRGTAADKVLFGQHNSDWINPGLPHAGKISIFNNGNSRPSGQWSEVLIIDPPIDASGNYLMDASGVYLPASFDFQWNGTVDGITFFSNYMSGVNMQPNGNLTICEATRGRFFEIDPSGNIVWHYQNPDAGSIVNQGGSSNSFDCYRAEKYPPNYSAFTGRDLTPMGIIENVNTVSASCDLTCTGLTAQISNVPAYTSSSSPITLIGTPSGGTFSGVGVIFNAFNPSVSGAGTHIITYTYTDSNNCTAVATHSILVFTITYNFVNYNLGTIAPKISSLGVELDSSSNGLFHFQLFNMQGQLVFENELQVNPNSLNKTINFPQLKKGAYIAKIFNETHVITDKLVITE